MNASIDALDEVVWLWWIIVPMFVVWIHFLQWNEFGIITQFIYKFSHIISAHWLYILQMAYNLCHGHGIEDEEQLPPPPPPPTSAELMQMVVEGQGMLADAMR
jgi:hypothetical protein